MNNLSRCGQPTKKHALVAGDVPVTIQVAAVEMPDPEVYARPKRRIFSPSLRRQILEEYDAAENGKKGAVLRRHGLFSSSIGDWRRQLDGSVGSQKRGRKPRHPVEVENARLRRKNERLNRDLERTRKVIDVQGNVFALLRELSHESADLNSKTDSSAP